MAEEIQNKTHEHEIKSGGEEVEKPAQGELIAEQRKEQDRVSDPEPVKVEEPLKEEEKKPSTTLLEMLHRDDDNNSSNSSVPGHHEDKKTEETAPPASASVVECTSVEEFEGPEKKSMLDKIKEKLPGHHAKTSGAEEDKKKEKD